LADGFFRPENSTNLYKESTLRVCIVYDCLYPFTVGGAERWYRDLAERLTEQGHSVTYLTLRQWPRGQQPPVAGIEVRAVGPQLRLYAGGRRRILPPLVFGAGVLVHLLRHGRRYDVVHTDAFPYFSVLAAALARRVHGYRLFVDWFELWTRDYWREYLGRLGKLGWLVQRRCVRLRQRAFCFSRLHERRLREEGFSGKIEVLEGVFSGPLEAPTPTEAEGVVVFAGRHIPEKRVLSIPPAVACARKHLPDLRAQIFGDGPERARLLELIRELDLDQAIEAPGFVDGDRIQSALRNALCLLLPSRREGYGLVVVEAAAVGTPCVVVAAPDNAATELVSEGENGFVADSCEPEELAKAILLVSKAGQALRERTAQWFGQNAKRLSIESSLQTVLEAYRR
jgi:glycosyltransferase involved in cell wall biosynthesis